MLSERGVKTRFIRRTSEVSNEASQGEVESCWPPGPPCTLLNGQARPVLILWNTYATIDVNVIAPLINATGLVVKIRAGLFFRACLLARSWCLWPCAFVLTCLCDGIIRGREASPKNVVATHWRSAFR